MNKHDEATPTDRPRRPARRRRGRRTRSRSRRDAARPRVPRKLLGGVALLLTVLLVTIWFAGPPLISGVARGLASAQADAAIEGGVEIENLSLSWLGAQRVEGVTITDPAGETLATLDSITVDRGLLALAFSPLDFGRVTLGGGEGDLIIDEAGGSNLARALAPASARDPAAADRSTGGGGEPGDPPAIPAGLSVEMVSAAPVLVRYRTPVESGELRLDLSSDRITPRAGGELRLEASEADGRDLRLTASFAGFRDGLGLLDVQGAAPRIEIAGERVPRAFEAIAAAGGGRGGRIGGRGVGGARRIAGPRRRVSPGASRGAALKRARRGGDRGALRWDGGACGDRGPGGFGGANARRAGRPRDRNARWLA